MSRLVTHAEIATVPDGGVYYLEDDARLTPLAEERARARGVQIQRGVEAGNGGTAVHGAPAWLGEVTQRVLERLGPLAPDSVDRVVAEVLAALPDGMSQGPAGQTGASLGLPPSADYCAGYIAQERRRAHRRAVLTATGRNQKGVVARLTTVIAELGGDVLDISQTLVGDYFTMLVIVDIGELTTSFEEFKRALTSTTEGLGAQAIVMHEDMVASMNRV